jgi:hypothetical protein
MKNRFHVLFAIAAEPDATMETMLPVDTWRVIFSRKLGLGERVIWDN